MTLRLPILILFLAACGCAERTAGMQGREEGLAVQGKEGRLTESEKSVFINSAKAELAKMNISIENRVPVVSEGENEVIVMFRPAEGYLSPPRIIKFERKTGKILDIMIGTM
jgi:hypothetical protein